MDRVIENQQKLIILIFTVLAFTVFGLIAPGVKAQVEKSNTFCTKVGNANDADNPCKKNVSGNFVYYCQADPAWQDECDIWFAGCGPTSLAMVASTFGVTITPTDMDAVFRSTGARICGTSPESLDGSTLPTFFASNWLETHGMDSSARVQHGPGSTIDLIDAKKFIDLGYILVTSSAGQTYPCDGDGWCKFPNGFIDHVFVIDQVDVANNSFEVRDPANCTQANPAEGPHNTRINNFAVQAIYAITTRQK